jgi:hypothetical protein
VGAIQKYVASDVGASLTDSWSTLTYLRKMPMTTSLAPTTHFKSFYLNKAYVCKRDLKRKIEVYLLYIKPYIWRGFIEMSQTNGGLSTTTATCTSKHTKQKNKNTTTMIRATHCFPAASISC